MTNITIQELKQGMAAILKRVLRGEWITVLKHGRAVARLGPPQEPGLHVGSRYGTGYRIEARGRRLSKGAYLMALQDDRGGEGE
jgi:antitoxin (DNA-binding transcriptional repressor) of toxin-antitoxin stability system